jgi:inosine triphosphate pyrophosphatase
MPASKKVHFTLVTGSEHKRAEYERLIPHIAFDTSSIDLEEIQSLNLRSIVEHKVRSAYVAAKKPVVVEDVAAGIDELGGLPGPFIKFFEEKLGHDALYRLAGADAPATITCTLGYYDGSRLLLAEGIIHGKIVAPRGQLNFGFDCCFIPRGATQTFAEMGTAKKDAISHRLLAISELLRQLNLQA